MIATHKYVNTSHNKRANLNDLQHFLPEKTGYKIQSDAEKCVCTLKDYMLQMCKRV